MAGNARFWLSAGMALPKLILASASPRRSELLRRLDVEFQVVSSNAAEVLQEQLTPSELAQINAYRKARAVSKRYPDYLVLGADTVVTLRGKLFGKPANLAEARRMLEVLQGDTHQVVTGVSMIHLRHRRERLFAEITEVTFRPLTLEQIDRYLASMNPLDKAGGYAIQEGGDALVQDVVGSYFNVVGLPLERLKAELGRWSGGVTE
ncbi:MAG: septum formation protein Maf [Verrucomicrobia bacterium]|nr:septum formation protein Maf [Verrucomicrobiota bacterium]